MISLLPGLQKVYFNVILYIIPFYYNFIIKNTYLL